MTYAEMVGILGPVALAIRNAVDELTFRAYHRVLKDVPTALLRAAADAALEDASLRFFPPATDWKGRCEAQRRKLLALHPFEACSACHGVGQVRTSAVGVVPIIYGPCRCRVEYQERLERLGIPQQPIAKQLTAGEDEAA